MSGLFEEYLLKGEFPPYIGMGVLRRAGIYYTSELAAYAMDEISQEMLKDYLVNFRYEEENFLSNVLYPIFASGLTEDVGLINDYAAAIIAEPPTISDALATELKKDLTGRQLANLYFEYDFDQQYRNLWLAQDIREAAENAPWYEKWGLTIWKKATPIVIGLVVGGPIGAKVGLVIAVESLIEDWIRDTYHISVDEQMHGLAYGAVLNGFETKQNIVDNVYSGFAQIRRESWPTRPEGQMESISHWSIKDDWLGLFEKQALSRITIRNTGSHPASFNIRAYYDRLSKWEMESFWIDSMRDPMTGEFIGWIDLNPGEARTIDIVFKDKDLNGFDIRPKDDNIVKFVLGANIGEAFYFLQSQDEPFDPAPAIFSASSADEVGDEPIVSYPIWTFVEQDEVGVLHTVYREVENPFASPISVKLTQALPPDAGLIAVNGGLVENDLITWRRIIEPHGSFSFSYIVVNQSPDESDVTLPAAELSLYMPEDNSYAVLPGVPITLTAPQINKTYLPLLIGAGSPVHQLENGTFEQGPGKGWSEYSANEFGLIVNDASLQIPAHEGDWLAWLGGTDDEVAYLWQQVDLPTVDPVLSFWYWILSVDACGYDYASVIINHATYAWVLDLCAAQASNQWNFGALDLSDFAGQSVQVGFLVQTDSSLVSDFYLDDVAVTSGLPPNSPAPVKQPDYEAPPMVFDLPGALWRRSMDGG